MELFNVLSEISESHDDGRLFIVNPKGDTRDAINQSVIYENESLDNTRHGEIYFKDKKWESVSGKRRVDFSMLEGELEFEAKSSFLLQNKYGWYEGGKGNKFDTVAINLTSLNKLAELLQLYGISTFHEFNNLPPLKIRNIFSGFIQRTLKLKAGDVIYPSSFYPFIDGNNYELLSSLTCSIFWEEVIKLELTIPENRNSMSYPIIPTGILKKQLSDSSSKITLASKKIGQWIKINNDFIEHISNFMGSIHDQDISAASTLTGKICRERFNSRLEEHFKHLDNLKLDVLSIILAFTGMRREEALSCKLGCAKKKGGKFFVHALLTKTDDGEILLPWVANEDTYKAVKVLEKYVKAMRKRARVILKYHSEKISEKLKHNLKVGLKQNLLFGVIDSLTSIKFTEANLAKNYDKDPSKDSKFTFDNFNYHLTQEDIDQLESIECNYKAVRGSKRGEIYKVGDCFQISPHMYRHTFAWFIIANRLGDLDDIKHQFKHLASSMTLIYAARGYDSPDDLISIFEHFEALIESTVTEEIAEEAIQGTLSGGGGKRLNKGAGALTIEIETTTNGRIPRQIHFKDLNEFKEFLTKNLNDLRGLPHGYCAAGSKCKMKNVGLPSGCVIVQIIL